MDEIIADSSIAGSICPSCNQPIEIGRALHVCEACGVAYHKEYWDQIGKCCSPYCSEATVDLSRYVGCVQRDERLDRIDDHMLGAYLSTDRGCLPFGIVALHFANKVNEKKKLNDYEGAVEAANNAQKWIYRSIFASMILIVVAAILWTVLQSKRY